MERLTYKQAYDKIIEAYFKDEIEPERSNFCFCGTLCGNRDSWATSSFRQRFHNYSRYEYGLLERALFSSFVIVEYIGLSEIDYSFSRFASLNELPDYEELLFAGMSAALDVLKQIHKERGEDVDEELKLTKRVLQTA